MLKLDMNCKCGGGFVMYLLGHIIGWLWLMLTVAIGLSRHSVKSANRFLILSRIGYLLIIITGVALAIRTLSGNWWLTLLKVILGLGTIGLIEVAFLCPQAGKSFELWTCHPTRLRHLTNDYLWHRLALAIDGKLDLNHQCR